MVSVTSQIECSIIICVNDINLYNSFIESIRNVTIVNYEIIKIDNFDGRYSLPEALNEGINRANGNIYLFCHQDILFPPSWLDVVARQITIVSERDHQWAILGIMGVRQNGLFAGSIIDPHIKDRIGHLPCEVTSLDEVCLIMRQGANLSFDESLGGFHLYGADICLQAHKNGLKCYAIDAPLTHLSGGKLDHSFWEMAEKLKKKWSRIEGIPNTIETTCGVFMLNESIWSTMEYNYKLIRRKIIRRLQNRHIKNSREK